MLLQPNKGAQRSPESQIDLILQYWGQDLSYSEIGKRLGLAKGTVSYWIAKARRAGLNVPWRQPALGTPENRQRIKQTVLQRPVRPGRPIHHPEPMQRLALNRPRTCLFVLKLVRDHGELLQCDAPTDGHPSYCPEHQAICYVPLGQRRHDPDYQPNMVPAPTFGSLGVRQ